LEYYGHFLDRSGKETYLDRPIRIGPPFLGSDGIVTVACNLFGPEFVCTAMALEPERLHRLFDFLTEATIVRIQAWREKAGVSTPTDEYWYADDSLALISTCMYRDHVLPYHRRIYDALAGEAPRCIHLCGDATRHFPLLHEELGITCFDTGFPVDFARLREQLGLGVIIEGGPRAFFLQTATPDQVYEETRRILESGVLRGGLFILREGNNLSPHTPLENTEAVIRAGKDFGTADRF
jgi:uroporphyrinogen-III decarboxylase